jgi:hypothetical protein
MSGLLFLKSDDFFIGNGNNGEVLCTTIPSYSLILFYSPKCEHCLEMIPIFKRELPGSINGCQFGIINVTSPIGYGVINMSKGTISPIEYVPTIFLYVNGRPVMKYNGPRKAETIISFVIEFAKRNNISQQRQQQQNKLNNRHVDNNNKTNGKTIPNYSLGNPLCGKDGVCYLTEEDLLNAVEKAKFAQNNQQQRR